jgi:type II secretory pathway component PulM
MLDSTEKMALNAAGILFAVLAILYLWAFWRGFVEGFSAWQEQLEARTFSDASALVEENCGSDRIISSMAQVAARIPESSAEILASGAASTPGAEL